MLQVYLVLWFIICGTLTFEYLALHTSPHFSILLKLQNQGFISQATYITPYAGKTLSLWLGWIGIGLMIVMNVYSIRKRADFMNGMGSVKAWLDFHIFCGLLGPTCVLFHSDFQVRGLVGLSFWCMVVVVLSGVIGRYVYLQLSSSKQQVHKTADRWWTKYVSYKCQFAPRASDELLAKVRSVALKFVGVPKNPDHVNPLSAFMFAMFGDARLLLALPLTIPGMPEKSRYVLKEYARCERKAVLMEPLQRLLGYWHALHAPFALVMYLAAGIHIVTALLFGVSG